MAHRILETFQEINLDTTKDKSEASKIKDPQNKSIIYYTKKDFIVVIAATICFHPFFLAQYFLALISWVFSISTCLIIFVQYILDGLGAMNTANWNSLKYT